MSQQKQILARVFPRSRVQWRNWLKKNHDSKTGVSLVIAKKGTGLSTLTIPDAVEEALCFGWIDSVANSIDDETYMIRMSPRNPKSKWSAINKKRVKKLLAAGLMTEAGLKVISLAKKSGTWTGLDKVERLEYPDDFQIALQKSKTALKNFEAFPPSARKAILYWITSAKRDETRRKRIDETISKARKNIRANEWTPKDQRSSK